MGTQDVEHTLMRGQQIIGDDSPMASPPYGFGAHDGTGGRMTKFLQPRQCVSECLAEGVIRVIVKTLILPKRVDVRRNFALPAAQAAERG